MNSYPVMTSMSDVMTVKRIDMENIQRKKRFDFTPKLVSWNVNAGRPSTYFPNIERSFIVDMTYALGSSHKRRRHENAVNREGIRPAQPNDILPDQLEEELLPELNTPESSLSDPLHNSKLRINHPLRLLSREYKQPLSMYEEAKKNVRERFVVKNEPLVQNPTLPRHYLLPHPRNRYANLERPRQAGKAWVMNRWTLWSGRNPTSP